MCAGSVFSRWLLHSCEAPLGTDLISEPDSESETQRVKETIPWSSNCAVEPGLLSSSLRRLGEGVQLLSVIGHLLFLA